MGKVIYLTEKDRDIHRIKKAIRAHHPKVSVDSELIARMQRINKSIKAINTLMEDLRNLNNKGKSEL